MKRLLFISVLNVFCFTLQAQNPLAATDAYVMETFTNPGQFGTLPLSGPFYPIPNIITNNAFSMLGGDFDGSGKLYTFVHINPDYFLGIVDLNTGAVNNPGDSAVKVSGVVAPQFLSQLSYNVVNDTFYALSHDPNTSTGTQLYSVDIVTGVLTPIGSGTGIGNGIALEIDNNGIGYSADANSGDFYSIDLSTGVGTVIGNSMAGGFYPVGQGFSLDHSNNTMYAVLQNRSGLIRSHFYTINLSNGVLTDLGDGSSRKYYLFAVSPISLGIDEIELNEISIYPNPFNGYFTIQLGKEYKDVTIQVTNLLGQIISIKKYNSIKRIETEINAPSGIFFVRLSPSKEQSKTFKIIKQ